MANTKNVTLNLLFDEPDGSLIVYDYSVNHVNGIMPGAKFASGKIGSAIQFSGEDTCRVSKNALSLSDEFSILYQVNPMSTKVGSPSRVIWPLVSDGADQYSEISVESSYGNWVSAAMTKKRAQYNFYVNTVLVKTINCFSALLGALSDQDYFGGEYGKGCVGDMRLYNAVLSQEDLIGGMSNTKQLTYCTGGVDLEGYGVHVSGSDKSTDRPEMKSPTSVLWDNYRGTCVDLNHKFYESQETTLSYLIKAAEGKGDFTGKVNYFFQIFDKAGTHRLMVDIHPTKPPVYEVHSEDAIAIKKTWDDSLITGTFAPELKEPSSVKKVLKFTRAEESTQNYSIKITTTKLADIYWGDGEVQTDIYGEDLVANHTFKSSDDYYIIVAGYINEAEKLETDATVVWNKL